MKTDPQVIFNTLRQLLETYAPPFSVTSDTPKRYDLTMLKPVEIAGRKRDDLFFAGVMINKGYVGFYYMPIYANPKLSERLSANLLKTLKGKSCFHVKHIDDAMLNDIRSALDIGAEEYRRFTGT